MKIKPFLFACFLLITAPLFALNDSIPKMEKIARVIPKNFKENYLGKEYVYQKQDPSWLLEFKMWLAQKLLSFFSYINYDKGFYHLKILFYVLITLLAIYIIARMIFYKEGTWIFKQKRDNNTLVYKDDIETIEVSNFELLIEKALSENNYRLAVRFFYLWTLQKLAKKEVIELSNIKTNADYQLELEGTPLYDSFHQLSYYYTYVWYGEFTIDQLSFDTIANNYQQFLKEIAS